MELLYILDILNGIAALIDLCIILRDLANYLSKRRRATYAIKTLFISYIFCTGIMIVWTLLAQKAFDEVGMLRFILFSALHAFLITTIVTAFKSDRPLTRLKKIQGLKARRNNFK